MNNLFEDDGHRQFRHFVVAVNPKRLAKAEIESS